MATLTTSKKRVIGSRHHATASPRLVLPPHPPQHVRDLPHRRPCPHRVDDRLHQRRRGIARCDVERAQCTLHSSRFPLPSYLGHPLPLHHRQRRIVRRGNRRDRLVVGILVHSHHDGLARLDRPLLRVRALGDRLLEQTALDRPRCTPRPLHLVHQRPRLPFHTIRQRFHVPAAAR